MFTKLFREIAGAALLVVAAAGVQPAQAANNGTNVLLIMVDDLNDWVGYMRGEPGGGPPPGAGSFTPNIDALAASGVAFTRAYAAAPICTPSRAAMLGGRRPGWTGVYDLNHNWKAAYRDRAIVPITKQFKANGYDVFGMGKVYHPQDAPVAAFSNGQLFTYYSAGLGGGVGNGVNLSGLNGGPFDWGSPANADTDPETRDYHSASDAITKINQPHAKPFFIALGFAKPHLPWYVPPQYFIQFPLSDEHRPPVVANDLADIPPPGQHLARISGFHNPERISLAQLDAAGRWNEAAQAYHASIAFVDGQVGRVIAALNASPYRDNTIVALVGDHGYHLGEKEHLNKAALWERTLRTPLIFSGPGIVAGGRSSRPIDHMSIYPTLTELTGVPAPTSGFDNVSIRPLLQNPAAAAPRPVALSTYWNGVSGATGKAVHTVRSERFRYTVYADGSEELYDEQNDPNEWINQASNPAFAANKVLLRKYIPAGTRQNRPPVSCYPGPCP